MPLPKSARRWCLSAALGAGLASAGVAADPPAASKPLAAPKFNGPAPVAGTQTGLAECIALAHERQPVIRAARASLAAALAGQRALANLSPIAARLSPDVDIRRHQAERGVRLALAEVCKVEQEATYDATFLYYSFVYARQQEATATDVLDQINVYYEIAKDLLKGDLSVEEAKKINQFTLYTMEEAMTEIRKLRIDAQTGQKLALAALREATGAGQESDLVPRDTELPVMAGAVTQEQIVALALAHRPELAQAAAGVDAFRLEICAQDKIRFRQTVPTLASGSDIHSRHIPIPARNGEYRPGGLHPEMPATLVGKREDRVARAVEISGRQDEVYAKTRELVSLEAVNAYVGWQQAAEKLAIAKERFDRGQKILKLTSDNAASLGYDVIVRNQALAGQAQAEYLKAAFETVKALARLQRVTAGGVVAAFPNN